MKIISQKQIRDLNISPAECVEWVKESFSLKEKAQLPAKISLHPQGNDFFNTMPCLLPSPHNCYGVKVVQLTMTSEAETSSFTSSHTVNDTFEYSLKRSMKSSAWSL